MTAKTSVQLYKYLLRCTQRLPSETQAYYKHHVKQSFKSHADENDPERVSQIIDRAVQDADWVLKKVTSEMVYPKKHTDKVNNMNATVMDFCDREQDPAAFMLTKFYRENIMHLGHVICMPPIPEETWFQLSSEDGIVTDSRPVHELYSQS